jgi:hypothetical protein
MHAFQMPPQIIRPAELERAPSDILPSIGSRSKGVRPWTSYDTGPVGCRELLPSQETNSGWRLR